MVFLTIYGALLGDDFVGLYLNYATYDCELLNPFLNCFIVSGGVLGGGMVVLLRVYSCWISGWFGQLVYGVGCVVRIASYMLW